MPLFLKKQCIFLFDRLYHKSTYKFVLHVIWRPALIHLDVIEMTPLTCVPNHCNSDLQVYSDVSVVAKQFDSQSSLFVEGSGVQVTSDIVNQDIWNTKYIRNYSVAHQAVSVWEASGKQTGGNIQSDKLSQCLMFMLNVQKNLFQQDELFLETSQKSDTPQYKTWH